MPVAADTYPEVVIRVRFPDYLLPGSYFLCIIHDEGFPKLNENGGRLFTRSKTNGLLHKHNLQLGYYGELPHINSRPIQPRPDLSNCGHKKRRPNWKDN